MLTELQTTPVGDCVLDRFVHLAKGFIEALRLEAGGPAKHRCPLLGPGRYDAALCASYKQSGLCSWTCMKATYVAGLTVILPMWTGIHVYKGHYAAGTSMTWPKLERHCTKEANVPRMMGACLD